MADNKLYTELTVMEAVDHLSSLAELDIKSPKQKEEEEGKINWLDPRDGEEKRETIKQTFRVINNYLHHLYEKDKGRFKDAETQRGVQSIMLLVGEAAQKLDKYTSFFKGTNKKNSVTYIKEYQDLQQYYLTKVMDRFQKTLENEEAWQEEWGALEEENLDIQKRGLKDLETVRRDKEYELFYIRREDGRPFFNRNLLRHIKLVGDFDETLSDPSGEDPLLKIKLIQDREAHDSAQEMLVLVAPYMDAFYKEAMRHKENDLVVTLSKTMMALMLSGNARNLLQNTMGKSCVAYFHDFQLYLRNIFLTTEYKKLIATPFSEWEKFSHTLMQLSSMLSTLFFTRQIKRKEAVALIRKLFESENKNTMLSSQKGVGFWNSLLEYDEKIRQRLKYYPNGPLLKTLDAFREGEGSEGFDPLMQENLPVYLFSFAYDQVNVSCIRLPCPTRQEVINKADLTEEFTSFARSSMGNEAGEKKHLLVNLQDRTSWQEHARSVALEKIQKKAEYANTLMVLTLPKNTEFYGQIDLYAELDEAELFLQQLKEQVMSGEQCGFYFPSLFKMDQIEDFTDKALSAVHSCFFDNKKSLERKERLDFIEIFYQLLILKYVDLFHPDSLSLTCKDAIDTGSAASAAWYAFLRILTNNKDWTIEEADTLLWIFYTPALFIRERAIDVQILHRTINMLATLQSCFDNDRTKITATLNKLYSGSISNLMLN